MDTLEIEFLPEKEWKGYLLPLDYESRECYDVRIDEERDMTVSFVRTALATPFVHRDSECAFPARLYEDYYEKAEAYGIRKGRKLLAAIELCQESWSNRMRVTNGNTETGASFLRRRPRTFRPSTSTKVRDSKSAALTGLAMATMTSREGKSDWNSISRSIPESLRDCSLGKEE